MSVIAPRLLIDGPALTPRPYSLLSAATILDVPDLHAENGLTWQPRTDCSPAETTNVDCRDDDPLAIPFDKKSTAKWTGADVEMEPFVVYSYASCSRTSGVGPDDADEQARRNLAAGEAYAVERAVLGAGDALGIGTMRSRAADLTPTAGTPAEPVALNPVGAVATLEAYLAENYLGVGTIHVAPAALTYLCAAHVVQKNGTRWETCNGTRVAVGAGYAGNVGPGFSGEAPAGEAWLYATGQVYVYRSEVFGRSFLNTRTNDVDGLAERVYAVGWECATAAVKMKMTCCC